MNNNYYFICNPASDTGRLKKNWPKMMSYIKKNYPAIEFEWCYTKYPLHAVKLVNDLIQQGFNRIIAVGGDGIANEVTNGLMQTSNHKNIAIGFLPMGTSNDGHIAYGSKDPKKVIDTIFTMEPKNSPLIKLTGDFSDTPHYAWNHVDCGLSALAAKSALEGSKLIKGEFKYTYHAIKQLLKFKSNKGSIVIDGDEINDNFSVIAVSFGEFIGGYKLWPGNSIEFGDLGILYSTIESRYKLLKLLLAAEKGNHIGKNNVYYLRGKKIEIKLENPWPYESEGEIFTNGSRVVNIEYIPNAISVIGRI